jgi:CRP/FNR family transcriptional regulator, cyclic AMP receptor protein
MPSAPSDRSENEKQALEIKKFFAGIRRALEAWDFQAAERLRDKLIEAYPLAIGEAIKSAELIEEEMSAAIDRDHLKIWPELYGQLTIEERNCLFHSMDKHILPDNRMLLKYGSLNNRLFFLERGQVTIAIPQGAGKFKVVAQLGRGDILGEYSFATIALCSATAVTRTPVQVRCLEGKVAESWEGKHPGLYGKVVDFCKKHGRVDQIQGSKDRARHTYPRYAVRGRVRAILLDKNGQKTEITFNGELEEISRSGTSFSIHCNNRTTVKKLLTRSFSLEFLCENKGQNHRFSAIGKVVRVSFLLYNDYLLHFGFHAPLPEELDVKLTS